MAGNDKAPTWVDAMLDGRMYEFGPNGRKRMKRKAKKLERVAGYVVALERPDGDTLVADDGMIICANSDIEEAIASALSYNDLWLKNAKIYKLVEVKGL